MSLKKAKEIEVFIRARYPIIYVVSWEEERVDEYLHDVANQLGKKLFLWSTTRGIIPYGLSPESQKNKNPSTTDPLIALDEVFTQVEPSIYVFKDFHSFMKEISICRKLRDIANYLRNSYKSLVITSPVLVIPPELEKDMTVVDFELPDKDDLKGLLSQIIQEVKNRPEINVNLDQDTRDKIIDAATGLTLKEAENVFAKTLVMREKLDVQSIKDILSEKKQIIRKSRLLEYYESGEDFQDVGGLENLKDWLMKRRTSFEEKARNFGLPFPRGVLLLGVQGCGKSLCAKAVAGVWNLPLLRLDMGQMFSSAVGSSEDNMRRAIKTAESISPNVLWIDELDKAFSGVQSSTFSDAGTTARVVGTFLTWLQEKNSPVFVIATANNISMLPPELLRKGRFDEIFYVDLPDLNEREEIFKIHIIKRKRAPGKFNINLLAKESEGFSGAEIEQCIISALYDAFAEGRDLTSEDIISNIKVTVPLSETMKEEIGKSRNWAQGRARIASQRGGD